ncbi:hypothetical protein HOC13_00570 [Candidatus Woesearchaeota archaeon]|jgi:hypothetical protein|nr:hypothetical protein [Candidatus Woesearchaeota archaeon]
MTSEELPILKEQLYEMEQKMRTMSWDYQQDQLHPFKKQQFEQLLKDKETLIEQITNLENVDIKE